MTTDYALFGRLIRAHPSAGKFRLLKVDRNDTSSLLSLFKYLVTSQH
jgi:hypothetical protein